MVRGNEGDIPLTMVLRPCNLLSGTRKILISMVSPPHRCGEFRRSKTADIWSEQKETE
jgi:hypothetical protein